MSKQTDKILKEVLERIEPEKEELKIINENLKNFLEKIKKQIIKSRANAEIFVGGSFAKGTLIKKKNYDIDIFARFPKNSGNISEKTKKLLKDYKFLVIHGSRDYFRIKINERIFFEVVPVIKIKNPKDAENITDLSFFHVGYIKKKIKSGKILDDIKLAKIFCHANGCYGAESYINGFSGYSLELLVYYYKGFMNFARAIARIKDKEIIDMEKFYKNKKDVLLDLNSSKLHSPIILIDPTYRQRNALAALKEETFRKFQKTCAEFLKSPNIKFFEEKEIDAERMMENSRKKKEEFASLRVYTNRQEGDIAGSKLLKFFRHLSEEAGKYFEIKNSAFDYDEKKSAEFFFSVKRKKELIVSGPEADDKKENIAKFRKRHKNIFKKGNRIYAKEKINFSFRQFLQKWMKQNKKKIREMSVEKIELT